MKTQQGASTSSKKIQTPQENQERQVQILESKGRARCWAEQNRIRNSPLAVACETTAKPQQTTSRPHPRDSSRIIEDLLSRKRNLLIELEEIETALTVIQRTS